MKEQVPALRMIGLHKAFRETVAVDHVDLTVPSGSFFGLVGPNGAGKTTALLMAVGLLRPDAGMVFEPRVGGHIIDRGTDGSECRWGRVLAYDPPRLVCFSWDINLRWQLETDPAKASEVEVTFTPLAPGRTRVVLTHRHLDRHGDGWEIMRDAVGAGWSLARYAEVAAQR